MGNANGISQVVPELLVRARASFPEDNPQLAILLSSCGRSLMTLKRWNEAEPLLRECSSIREKSQPDDWLTFRTSLMLGSCLLGQGKFEDAEPYLLAGYQGLVQREPLIPKQIRIGLTESLERLVNLYNAWQKPEPAEEWRKKLDEWGKRIIAESVDSTLPAK